MLFEFLSWIFSENDSFYQLSLTLFEKTALAAERHAEIGILLSEQLCLGCFVLL